MSPTPTIDDLERDIARTLRAKADQLTVDASPFPDAAVGHVESSRVRVASSPRRRLLAVAAVMVLLAGGAAVLRGWSSGTSGHDTTDATGASEAWLDQTVAFWPAGDDWEPMAVSPFSYGTTAPTRWRLFAEADDTSPGNGGVLVGSTRLVEGESTAIEVDTDQDPQYQIHGTWAHVAAPRFAGGFPRGTILASWADGTTLHRAVAVGGTAAELAAVLNSLTPAADPAAGFGPPADGSLVPIATATTADEAGTNTSLTGPSGQLTVSASPPARYGGLLRRLAGTPTDGGLTLTTDADVLGEGTVDATYVRDDGWFVTAAAGGAPGGTQLSIEDMSELARNARPVTRREVIDWAVGRPVTGTAIVGEWTVRLHGTDESDTGVCVVPRSGAELCAIAADTFDGATTASVPVGDQWLVVVIVRAPDRPLVRTAPNAQSDLGDLIEGETGRSDGRLVHVVNVPDDVQSVRAGSWDGVRTPYERPLT